MNIYKMADQTTEAINKNLVVAKKLPQLLDRFHGDGLKGNQITVSPGDFLGLDAKALNGILRRLDVRGCLSVGSRAIAIGQKKNYIDINIRPRGLKKFIATAESGTIGIKTVGDKKIVVGLIERLLGQNKLDLTGKSNRSEEAKWLEWIGDYSGLIDIERGLVLDGDGSDAIELASSVKVVDHDGLARLRDRIKTTAVIRRGLDDLIAVALSNGPIRWYCRNCGRFLLVILSTPNEVQDWLRNFKVGKYKKCPKDRLSNYFKVRQPGKLTFEIKEKSSATKPSI